MYMRFSQCSNRNGLTLVEVIASLAMLATLLVGALMAYNGHAEQMNKAKLKREAIRRIDLKLCEWTSSSGVPAAGSGDLPGEVPLVWKAQVINTKYHNALGIDLVRITVESPDKTTYKEPLISLEVAVHAKARSTGAGIQ